MNKKVPSKTDVKRKGPGKRWVNAKQPQLSDSGPAIIIKKTTKKSNNEPS
jgi:hypothetical protein